MPRIVIPDDAPPVMAPSAAYRKLLAQTSVDYYDTLPGTEERLIERIAGAEIVISVRSSTRFSENVFRNCPGSAARHGVTVTNTPGVSAFSIAEHALALMLAVARRIPLVDAGVRQASGRAGRPHNCTARRWGSSAWEP